MTSYPSFKKFALELIDYVDALHFEYEEEINMLKRKIDELSQKEKKYISDICESKQFINQVTQQNDININELNIKHKIEMDDMAKIKHNVPLIQSLSKENSELKRDIKSLESQLKLAKNRNLPQNPTSSIVKNKDIPTIHIKKFSIKAKNVPIETKLEDKLDEIIPKPKEVKSDKLENVETNKLEIVETNKSENVETDKLEIVETNKSENVETNKSENVETNKLENVETNKSENVGTDKLEVETNKSENVETDKLEVETDKLKELETNKLELETDKLKIVTDKLSEVTPKSKEVNPYKLKDVETNKLDKIIPEPQGVKFDKLEDNTDKLETFKLEIIKNETLDKKTLSKIKIRGIVYYITKIPNEQDEFALYECINNYPKNQVGKKNKDGMYVFSR